MPATQAMAPLTQQFPAAIEVEPSPDPGRGQRCRIRHRNGFIDAWTWLNIADPFAPGVATGVATTMEIDCGETDYLLLGFAPYADQSLQSTLSHSLCPVPGVVQQTTGLIDRMAIPALRRFTKRALLQPGALTGFWVQPASRRDHHA